MLAHYLVVWYFAPDILIDRGLRERMFHGSHVTLRPFRLDGHHVIIYCGECSRWLWTLSDMIFPF